MIFDACKVGWTKATRRSTSPETKFSDCVDHAEALVSDLWCQLSGQVPEEDCIFWHAEQYYPLGEPVENCYAETSACCFLVIGEVIIRYLIRHGFPPYSLCKVKGGERPAASMGAFFFDSHPCCLRHVESLCDYSVDESESLGGSQRERFEEAFVAWEDKVQPGTVPDERSHREFCMANVQSQRPLAHARSTSQESARNLKRIWYMKGGRNLATAPERLRASFKNALEDHVVHEGPHQTGSAFRSWAEKR